MIITKIKTPYITLGQWLKYQSIVSSGGEVKIFLDSQAVLVNGEHETRRGRKLYSGDVIDIQEESYLIQSHADQ